MFAMHRFFVPPACITGDHVRLGGDVVRRVGRVLRMSPGDAITLLDNSGREYVVSLTRFSKDVVDGTVVSVEEGRSESQVKITLYQGMLKGEKIDWVLQKGTELGVTVFVPLICQRSVPQERGSWSTIRYVRWRKILTEAAEQSGRCLLPQLGQPMPFEDACNGIKGSTGTSIIPWEQEGANGLRSVLSQPHMKRLNSGRHQMTPTIEAELPSPSSPLPPEEGELKVNIFIGPEGGFEEREVDYARSCGAVPVSLGRRILRSETAGLVAVSAVLYEVGELGG